MGYSPWGHKESDMTERLLLLIPIVPILQMRILRLQEFLFAHKVCLFARYLSYLTMFISITLELLLYSS